MAKYLRQSTASQEIVIGRMVDSTDGDTEETGLTIANTDIKLFKRGATTLANKNSGGGTHIANGMYSAVLDATDTATLGELKVFVHVAGALAWEDSFCILPANVFDALVLGTDLLDVSVEQLAGSAISQAAGVVNAAVTSSSINAIADQVWDEILSGHVAAGSAGAGAYVIRSNTAQSGDATHIQLDASASAVDDFYNNQFIYILSGTGAGQGRIISDYVGSTKQVQVSTWATNPDNTSVFVIKPFGSVPGASAPTAAEVADAVWDESISGHATASTFGQYLTGSVLQTGTAQSGNSTTAIQLASAASSTDDRYNRNIVTIISGTGFGQTSQITDYTGSTRVATVDPPFAVAPSTDSVYMILPLGIDAATVSAVADAVWDEQRSAHIQSGSFGEFVNADAVRISGDAGAADNAESFFDGTGYAGTNNVIPTVTAVTNVVSANVTQLSGDTTAADNAESFFDGTGYAGTGNVIPSVTTVTGNVNGNVTGNVGGNVVGTVASVVGNVGGNVVGSVATVAGNVVGTIGGLAAAAKADVNAEVLDVLTVDTFAEPTSVHAATASLKDKLGLLAATNRNKMTQTATTKILRNDGDSGTIATSTISDDGTTFTRGKIA